MRPHQNSNSNQRRPRGRNHNSSGPRRSNNVPLRHQTFDSNGPGVRIRGNAFQVHEKYMSMARDATASGDHVTAENLYQHAEHYYRIMMLIQETEQSRAQSFQRADGPAPMTSVQSDQPEVSMETPSTPSFVEATALSDGDNSQSVASPQ